MFSALILIGGRSRRMKQDKAALDYGGVTALELLCGQLRQLTDDIIISKRQEQNVIVPDCRTVDDALTDAGPLAGIIQGVRAARHEWVFVISVDTPRLERGVLDGLQALAEPETAAVMPQDGERFEPLYALYNKRAAAVLEKMLEDGCRRPAALSEYAAVATLKVAGGLIININTPEEYAAYMQFAGQIEKRSVRKRLAGAIEVCSDELIREQYVSLKLPDGGVFKYLCTPSELPELFAGSLYVRGFGGARAADFIRTAEGEYLFTGELRRREEQIARGPGILPDDALIADMQAGFSGRQELFRRTGAAHAAALFDETGRMLSHCEDIGRHNALDKAIGKAVFEGTLRCAAWVLLSSRLSVELAEKLQSLPVRAALVVGAPSSAAVDLCQTLGIALAGFCRGSRYNVY